jgi:small subunit ribosomal protein S8
MLSSLKNASMTGKSYTEVLHTKQNERILQVLKQAGFIETIKVFKDSEKSSKGVRVDFVMVDNRPKLTEVKRVSKPGSRVYKEASKLRKVAGGFGVGIISTSRGVMDFGEAKKKKLGGEVICIVY